MKKRISVLLTVLIVLNIFCLFAYSSEESMDMEDFYGQVRELANNYDDSGGLASGGLEKLYTNRLIVKTETNEPLKNYYDAIAVVEGYDGLHFLQFSNKAQAEYAYNSLSFADMESIEYVEYDFYMKLVNNENNTETNLNHLSWNSDAVQVDEAFDLIYKNNIECNEVNVAVIDSGTYASHEYFNNEEKKRIIDNGFIYDVVFLKMVLAK